MKQKTKKILRRAGITSICIVFLGVFAFMFVTKCIFGASPISRYSLYCYLCVDSDIRYFPLTGIDGQPEYNSNTEFIDGVSHFPPSNSIKFKTANLPSEIQAKAKDYFELLGFGEVSENNYEGVNSTWYIKELKNSESLIIIEIQQTKNDFLNQVTITKNFFTNRYKV